MKEKTTLKIRVPGSHAKNDRPGVHALVLSFLAKAGVGGNVSAILGRATIGRPHLQGIEGIQVKRVHLNRVTVRVQPGSNDSACELSISPPSGMSIETLLEKLKGAESRNVAEAPEESDFCLNDSSNNWFDDNESASEVSDGEVSDSEDEHGENVNTDEDKVGESPANNVPDVMINQPLTQTDVDRLGNEYIEVDERAQQKRRAYEDGRSRAQSLRNELKNVDRRIESAVEDQRSAELRAKEIREAISQLTTDLQAVLKRTAESQSTQKKAIADRTQRQAEIDHLLSQVEEDQAEASRLSVQAEALQKQHANAEAELRTMAVADRLKGVTLEELIAAARIAGYNIQATK